MLLRLRYLESVFLPGRQVSVFCVLLVMSSLQLLLQISTYKLLYHEPVR
jgi:hypothetical protein